MTVKTKLTFNDFLGLQFLLVYRKPAFIVLSLFGAGMLTFAVLYFLGYWQEGSFPVFQLIFAAFTLIVLPYSIYSSAKKQFSKNENLRQELTYTFGRREVEIKGETFVSFLPWAKTHKVEELNNWILIYQDDRSLNVIPKKGFEQNSLVELRDIVKNVKGLKIKLKG